MTWQIDHAHSRIGFSARHMMVAKVRGEFTRFEGTVALDEAHPENTTVTVSIDAASIDTGLEARVNHLRSGDFLDAEAFPSLDFVSRRVAVLGADRARLVGDLTIRGVTKEVALDTVLNGAGTHPMFEAPVVGFNATTTVKRSDFGLTEVLGLVSDEIVIDITTEAVEAKALAAALKAMAETK